MAKSNNSWASKLPKDMTDEELRTAKEVVADELGPMQERMNVLGTLAAHLDSEISTRFRLSSNPVLNLQVYPVDAIAEMYGDKKSTE